MKVYANGVLTNTQPQSEYYVLCNWGWRGYQDGYYKTGVFDCRVDGAYDDYTQSSRSEVESKTGEIDYYQYNLKTVVGIRR